MAQVIDGRTMSVGEILGEIKTGTMETSLKSMIQV
jgi:hypothetical protein